MRSKVIHFLDDYARFCPSERKYTLAGNSFYFKIYVFTKESLDIVKELDTEHELKKEDYGEFCNWIDSEDEPFILKCSKKKKKKKKSKFDICYQFFKDCDANGRSTSSKIFNFVLFQR